MIQFSDRLKYIQYYLQKARTTENERDRKNYILIAEGQIKSIQKFMNPE